MTVFFVYCGSDENGDSNFQSAVNPETFQDWPSFRGDVHLTGYSEEVLSDSLKTVWVYEAGDEIMSSAVIVGDRVYSASMDGNVFALTLHEGRRVWHYAAESSVESSPYYYEDQILIGTMDGLLISLDAKSGLLNWSYETGGQISGAATSLPDTETNGFFVGSYDACLHCVNPQNGEEFWKFETDNYINGTPGVWKHFVLFGGCDGLLHK